jgi:hypothetical protein
VEKGKIGLPWNGTLFPWLISLIELSQLLMLSTETILSSTKYVYSYQVMKEEMDGICSMHRIDKNIYTTL